MPKVGTTGTGAVPVRAAPSTKAGEPFWATTDRETVRLYLGNVTDVLAALPAKSVHCVVTSPPYWGLRDYGTGTWQGGDPACDHSPERRGGRFATPVSDKQRSNAGIGTISSRDCPCGARRIDHQLGSEPSPDCGTHGKAQCGRCFVCSMVAVFRSVYRVLRDDGTCWLNLGDSYSSGGKVSLDSRDDWDAPVGTDGSYVGRRTQNSGSIVGASSGLPSGNLVGVPWRVALALQADGWVLRQDVIWHKPAPMPESVRNRCTKAHEYVFLLAKRAGYFYDAEAIKTTATPAERTISGKSGSYGQAIAAGVKPSGNGVPGSVMRTGNLSNKRSVWSVSSQGYKGAHFATFPPKLIEPMIKAGTSEHGCCGECGTPWKRVVEERKLTRDRPNEYVKRVPGMDGIGNTCANDVAGVETRTVGWEPGCGCKDGVELGEDGWTEHSIPHAPVPCTVLDPFVGSGTTCAVSIGLGRHSVGIDLSEKYLRDNAIVRIEGELLARPDMAHLVPRAAPKKVVVGKVIS